MAEAAAAAAYAPHACGCAALCTSASPLRHNELRRRGGGHGDGGGEEDDGQEEGRPQNNALHLR